MKTQLNTQRFFYYLGCLWKTGEWTMAIENTCIHLRRKGSDTIFSPLTAVYYYLTGIEIPRGSFWVEEFNQGDFEFPWWEILEISYAWCACSSAGHDYSRPVRDQLLKTLSVPVAIKIPRASVLRVAA